MIKKQSQGYPLLLKGNEAFLTRYKPILSTIITLPKPISINIPFNAFFLTNLPISITLEPIIHLQIIDDQLLEQIIKNKYHLKLDTFYVYFPSQFRVDQKVYRTLCKNYEALLDAVPRNLKQNIQKYILWQEGKSQHSIQYQKSKLTQSLSQFAKQQIEAKILSLTLQIKNHQNQIMTTKSLMHLFLLKNKLAVIYAFLGLNGYAGDVLADVWNQIMGGFRFFLRLEPLSKLSQRLDVPEDIPRLPYIFTSTTQILSYFQTSQTLMPSLSSSKSNASPINLTTSYLRITTHVFLNFFTFAISIGNYYQALSKLKIFIDHTLNNVLVLARRSQWSKEQAKIYEIARNAWVVEVVLECLGMYEVESERQMQKQKQKEKEKDKSNYNNIIYNSAMQKKFQQTNQVHISICSTLRNSIQRIGFVLYNFDNYSIFPKTLKKQLQFLTQKMAKIKQPWHHHYKKSIQSIVSSENEQQTEQNTNDMPKSASFYTRLQYKLQIPQIGPNNLKLHQLLTPDLPPKQSLSKLLINFQTYTQVYLQILQKMYLCLKTSPYSRVAKSLKVTFQRATIYLGDWQHYEELQEQAYQFVGYWENLGLLEKLYRMFFVFVRVLDQIQKSTWNGGRGLEAEGEWSGKEYSGRLKALGRLLSEIVKDQNLIQHQKLVLNIIKLIQQTLQISTKQFKCILSYSSQIDIKTPSAQQSKQGEPIILTVTLPQPNLTHLIQTAHSLEMITDQVMLNQGKKVYKLGNIRCRQYKICESCRKKKEQNKQCTSLCLQKGTQQTVITADINLQEQGQQSLFCIQEFVLKIFTQQNNSVNLHIINLNTTNLYKINTPKLFPSYVLQQPQVYSQLWTPFTFLFSDVMQDGAFVETVEVFVHTNHANISINEAIRSSLKVLQEGDIMKQKQKQGEFKSDDFQTIQVSQFFCVEFFENYMNPKQKKIKQKQYNKIKQLIKLHLSTTTTLSITVFLKNQKPLQSFRNSKRKSQHPLNPSHNRILYNLELQLKLRSPKMNNKQYILKSQINNIGLKELIEVQYVTVQSQEEFVVKVLRDVEILVQQIKIQPNKQQILNNSNSISQNLQNNQYILTKDQTLALQSRLVKISPLLHPKLSSNLNLNDWFSSQNLLQQRNNTFKIWYKHSYEYSVMMPIQIQSQEIGNVCIPALGGIDGMEGIMGTDLNINGDISGIQHDHYRKQRNQYQFIGKIHGQLTYMGRKQDKCINLWLVPVVQGNIVLPEIWINGKKGIWVNSVLNNVHLVK